MKKVMILSLCMMGSTVVSAQIVQPEWYVGLGYHMGEYSEDDLPDFDPSGLKLDIGKSITPIFDIELNYLSTGDDIAITETGGSLTLSVDSILSVFAKGNLAFT